MNRRTLLSAMASAGIVGCLAIADSTDIDDPNADNGPPEPFGLPAGETGFQGIVNGDVDRVVTTAAFDPDGAPIYPHRSPVESDLPAEIEFELENATDEEFSFGPYHTVIWKVVDDEWYHVAPVAWEDLAATIAPGDSYDWSFTFTGEDPIGVENGGRSRVGGLGGGEYAFTIDGRLPTATGPKRFGFAAFFELRGEPVELTPTPDAEATREGEIVRVTTGRLEEGDRTRAEFLVERLLPEDAESIDAEPLIAEQLLRPRGYATGNLLRNVLAHFEDGVEVVSQRGWSDASPPFGLLETRHLEYEGETYRVSAEGLEDE